MQTQRRFLLGALVLVGIASCAGSKIAEQARQAEKIGRYDQAVALYTRAVAENPDDARLAQDLAKSKLRASEAHALEAVRRMQLSDLAGAREEYQIALTLNPTNQRVVAELGELEETIAERGAEAERRSLAALKRELRDAPFGNLQVAPGGTAPAGFVFRDASLRDVLLSLGTLAGVNVIFDSDFRDQDISIDLEDATFEEAFRSLTTTTQHFFRVESGNIITIVPDTQAKRQEYEQQVSRTFFLSAADLKETIDLLRITLGARRIAPHTANNALTIVDTPERVQAADLIISSVDKSRSEVIVEVEVLEVNRTRMDEYGVQFRSAAEAGGIRAGAFPADTTANDAPYGRDNLAVFGLPGAVISLLRADSDTRVLANPQLRAVDGETAQAEFGERVPVPITTFSPHRSRRREPATHHDVSIREHRGKHPRDASGPSRQRDQHRARGSAQHDLRRGVRGAAKVRQPRRQYRAPPRRRRDESAGRPHQRYRAHQPDRDSWARERAAVGTDLLGEREGDPGIGHRAHADASDHPTHRRLGGGPAPARDRRLGDRRRDALRATPAGAAARAERGRTTSAPLQLRGRLRAADAARSHGLASLKITGTRQRVTSSPSLIGVRTPVGMRFPLI